MPTADIETYHADGKWRNCIEAIEDLPGVHDITDEAVRVGRDEARDRKVEHNMRNLDGTIGERNTMVTPRATLRAERCCRPAAGELSECRARVALEMVDAASRW